jgi:hypothetical protein
MAQDTAPTSPRTLASIERDIGWFRAMQRAAADACHEGEALWYEGQVDQLIDEWAKIHRATSSGDEDPLPAAVRARIAVAAGPHPHRMHPQRSPAELPLDRPAEVRPLRLDGLMRTCLCGRSMRSKIHDTCRVCRTGQRTGRERGYNRAHELERERLRPSVEAGEAHCAQPVCHHDDRAIHPGEPWALGHNDDRTTWIGPVHADCNAADGARKARRIINNRRPHRTQEPQAWHSRQWT